MAVDSARLGSTLLFGHSACRKPLLIQHSVHHRIVRSTSLLGVLVALFLQTNLRADTIVRSKTSEGHTRIIEGTSTPLEFRIFDERTKRYERGFGYRALLPGDLIFKDHELRSRWQNATNVLHFKKGDAIAILSDPDLDAELEADRGRLEPLLADLEALRRVKKSMPLAVSKFESLLKEGESLLQEASLREKEMERDILRQVVSPADAEIIEGTRHSININPRSADLFRYYPLSHIRSNFRIPLDAWGPDWPLQIEINGQNAQLLKVFSADLDESTEEWILGLEFRLPLQLASMNEAFKYRLKIYPPHTQRFDDGLELHSPTTATVGQRRSYHLTAPKVSGMLHYTQAENAWVEQGTQVGGVKLDGMESLLQKISDHRSRAARLINELERKLIPSGMTAEHESNLILLRQNHASAGRLLNRIGAMSIEAKERGLLVGTLDYVGPLSALSSDTTAKILSPFVEASNVLVAKSIDIHDSDIVIVELPSGGQRLAKVFEVTQENVGSIQDLRELQRISVLIHNPDFQVGDHSTRASEEGTESVVESGMPVSIRIPRYIDDLHRNQIQAALKARFDSECEQVPSGTPLYPIRFTFRSSLLTPLEKKAYMQLATPTTTSKSTRSYVDLLKEGIIAEQNPELRLAAFSRLVKSKYNSGFDPFVEIAVRGEEDVANAALFYLYEKRRPFELYGILRSLHPNNLADREPFEDGESRSVVCFEFLKGMLEFHDPNSDALTHFIRKGRLESSFQTQLDDLFGFIFRQEGVNARASLRILRGHGEDGQPFLTESDLQLSLERAEQQGNERTKRIFQRELSRRILMGISRQSRYGYGATFVESGFMYLRDLQKIDSLEGSRQNYLHDMHFLQSSPNWWKAFMLDPVALKTFRDNWELPPPVASDFDAILGHHVDWKFELAIYRKMAKTERSRLIGALGTGGDFHALVMLLHDPFVQKNNAGDILDFLMLTPESRLELARFYSFCDDAALLHLMDQRQFAVEVMTDMDVLIRQQENAVLQRLPIHSNESNDDSSISPATIHIYQQVLLKLVTRSSIDAEQRRQYLATWFGLLPSAFELQTDYAFSLVSSLQFDLGSDDIANAVQYVRQRRALQYAVGRERDKRSESAKVEVQPGADETILRRTMEQIMSGMPIAKSPLARLQESVDRLAALGTHSQMDLFALNDTLRLVLIRDEEFATGHREHLSFFDIARYTAWIAFSPFYMLAIIPLIWSLRAMLVLISGVRFNRSAFPMSLKRNLSHARRLLRAVDDTSVLRDELSRWITVLDSESINLDGVVRLQESAKRIMNSREILYRVNSSGLDTLHPDTTMKIAPCLTLLALLSRLTGERIVEQAESQTKNCKRLYYLTEWFFGRSIYFSGYRYTLDSLTNHQIAETYIWQSIPSIDVTGLSLVQRIVCIPINAGIRILNLFGRIFLSLPMRFLYLFVPISAAGSTLFQTSLRNLVIRPGNLLEEDLYPEPEQIMQATRKRLRIGWTGRETSPDLPGGRLIFTFRRIATRLLPFMVIATVACGGSPYIYAFLSQGNWDSAWNIRSTGVYPAFSAIFVLAITMVLHWLPLLSGWLPFNHVYNLIAIRQLRRHASMKFLLSDETGLVHGLPADDELRRLYIEDAMNALRLEKEAEEPLLDMVVLMVEIPEMLDKYRILAESLVNNRTTVLAYATDQCMDGGGARLDTLKRIQETYSQIRARNSRLPVSLEETRSYFMPIGKDCNPLADLPFKVPPHFCGSNLPKQATLTPFVLAIANVQAFMRSSFSQWLGGTSERFVGSITATPQRMYVGPHDVDQGGRFRGGITLVGAFESIKSAVRQRSMVLMGEKAFIRSSTEQLQNIIQNDASLAQWLDHTNVTKRQLPVGQIVIERFRTADRYRRHISTCIRYIEEIKAIRTSLLEMGPQNERDVSDKAFMESIAIHYMRHLIVPWFIVFQGGSLESYRSAVLTGNLGVRDRRRIFDQRVLELIELFQEEGQFVRRQLPKIRFVSAPTARIFCAKTAEDVEHLRKLPQILFPRPSMGIVTHLQLEPVLAHRLL